MCCRLSDGAVVWSERSFAPYGTLMIAGDKLVILDEMGDLVIARATADAYHELARTRVLNSRSWVMPVLAGRADLREEQQRRISLSGRSCPAR